ncbi:MAG: hypothetical protein S4CHLAM20_10770 [Chlamydiia bacterium]|nr:hypothetical protein [Chlamydiia bacterium]
MKKLKLLLFCFSLCGIAFAGNTFEVKSYGDCYSTQMTILYPKSVSEVQAIIKDAKKKQKKVCVIGAGFSQGKQYQFSNSILINLKELKAMNLNKDLLSVQAGALWKDIHEFINSKSLALQVMQGSNIFSVGGSLSVNCHGWDFKKGSIVNTVEEITIIDANGELKKLSKNNPLFNYVIGGYGCFGVIVEAKIRLIENHTLREVSHEIAIKDYVKYFKDKVQAQDEILMHRYRLSLDPKSFFKDGIVTDYKKLDDKSVVSDLSVDHGLERMIKVGFWLERNFPILKRPLWKIAKLKILKEKITSRNEVMSPPTEFHFEKKRGSGDWLQEFFVTEEELVPFVNYLGKTLQKNDVKLLNATIRYVKKQPDRGLAYAPNNDRFAVVLFFRQSLSPKEMHKTKIWVQEVFDYILKHNGSFYLPYQHFATKEQFQRCYPNWEEFKAVKVENDPELLFYNGLYDDYIEKLKSK